MSKAPLRDNDDERGQLLVGILRDARDFQILQDQLWYRIPKRYAPKHFPPEYLALYQGKTFGADAYAVNYWGRVRDIRLVKRRELLPNDLTHPRSDEEYYQIQLASLERLPDSIHSARWRRILFIPTTLEKFRLAREINDLFAGTQLEDLLWQAFKKLGLDAEREWFVKLKRKRYALDFALFCDKGQIDVETDGDTYHANPIRAPRDNVRNNALTSAGWQVLRFSTQQVCEEMTNYCIPQLLETIQLLGGLTRRGIMPRNLYLTPDGLAEQLVLFEDRPEYELD